MGGLSDHVGLHKNRMVGVWIKRRELVNAPRSIRSEKLREHQFMDGYTSFLESKSRMGKVL